MGLEGYKGNDNFTDINKNMPESFESQKNDKDKQGENTKSDLDDLKKQIDNQNNQLNAKIDETIETFEDLSGTKLDEKQKEELKKLLQETAINTGKPNQYIGEVSNLVKESEQGTSLDDLKLVLVEMNNEYNLKTENNETKSLDEELKNKENNLKNLYSSLDNLSQENKHVGDNIKNKINNLLGNKDIFNNKDLFNQEYEQIVDLLRNDDNTFVQIADDLRKQDEINGTNNYKEFKESLKNIDNEAFSEKIDKYESGFLTSPDQLKLGTKTEKGIEKDGDIIRQKTDDGINIEVGEDGRKVGLSESDYKLQSDLGNENVLDEVENKKEEFTKFMKGINEELNSISSVLDYIEDAISNNIEIDDVKEEIRETNSELYNSLNLDSFTDIQEMKNAISGLYKQKEEEKEKYVKQAKRIVDEIVEKNALNAREKDEKVQDTLKFLKSIGFDLIPQDITDNIISQLNSNSGLRNMLGFNSLIDFENGNLGIDSNGDSNNMSLNEKVKFAEIFNTMIGGDDKGPININALRNASGSPISNTSNFNVYLVDNKLKDSGYASSIMLRNLEKFATKGK